MAFSPRFMRFFQILRYHGVVGLVARVKRKLKAFPASSRGVKWADGDGLSAPPSLTYEPLISLVCPVCDPPLPFFRELIESLTSQSYTRWELCLADDASTNPLIQEYIRELEQQDQRIKVVFRESRGHIGRASQDALQCTTGEWIGLIDHDDKLLPGALASLVEALQVGSNADILYSDELIIDEAGNVIDVAEKPEWSPLYLLGFMYVGHLTVYSRRILERVGGFRTGFDGSQDYDLLLRAMQKDAVARHIPKPLYAWRAHAGSVAGAIEQKAYAFRAAERALDAALTKLPLEFPIQRGDSPYPGVNTYEASSSSLIELVTPFPLTEQESHALSRLKEIHTPYIFCYSDAAFLLSDEELRKLLAPLALQGIACTGPLFTRGRSGGFLKYLFGRGGVVAAGFSFIQGEYLPNLAGHDTHFGGPGHRLYAAHEVEAISSHAFCCRTNELFEFFAQGATKTNSLCMHGLRMQGAAALVPLVSIPLSPSEVASGGPLGFITSQELSLARAVGGAQ